MNIKLILLATALLIINISTAFAQNKTERIDSLFTSLSESSIFNGNVLIAEKGKIIYEKSFGYANEITKEALNKNTAFELASVSKPFTALAIMILKEKKKLKLEDKVIKYLPELDAYPEVTIKSLLNHTNGLPDYMSVMDTIWDKSKVATNEDVISILNTYRPNSLFAPNTQNAYSNTGYVLLASIIERVSGLSYAKFMEKAIFKPLHMDRTFVDDKNSHPRSTPNYALGYLYIKNKYILPEEFPRTQFVTWLGDIVGDGSVNSTILDLYKFDMALQTEQLISRKAIQEIFTNEMLVNGDLAKNTLGWRVLDTEPFGKIARKSGGWPGYNTYMERNIDTDKTIIILQNHYNNVVMPKQEVRNILYDMPLPKSMLEFYNQGKSVDKILEMIKDPTEKYLVSNFYESGINRFGYELLQKDRNEDALEVFRYNSTMHPESSNAMDSLAECLVKIGQKEKAIKAYEKSLELNPNNKNAASNLAKL